MQATRSEEVNSGPTARCRRSGSFPWAHHPCRCAAAPQQFLNRLVKGVVRPFPNNRRATVAVMSGAMVGVTYNQIRTTIHSHLHHDAEDLLFLALRRSDAQLSYSKSRISRIRWKSAVAFFLSPDSMKSRARAKEIHGSESDPADVH